MIRINRLNNIINHAINNIKEKSESKGLSQKISHIHNFLTVVLWILQLMKKPFDMLDTDDERNRIEALFTEENGKIIRKRFSRRAKIGEMDTAQAMFHHLSLVYLHKTTLFLLTNSHAGDIINRKLIE